MSDANFDDRPPRDPKSQFTQSHGDNKGKPSTPGGSVKVKTPDAVKNPPPPKAEKPSK